MQQKTNSIGNANMRRKKKQIDATNRYYKRGYVITENPATDKNRESAEFNKNKNMKKRLKKIRKDFACIFKSKTQKYLRKQAQNYTQCMKIVCKL